MGSEAQVPVTRLSEVAAGDYRDSSVGWETRPRPNLLFSSCLVKEDTRLQRLAMSLHAHVSQAASTSSLSVTQLSVIL